MKKQYHNEQNTITESTIYPIANPITIKALQTHFAKSGSVLAFDTMLDAMAFSRATAKDEYPLDYTAGEGADLIQDTALYLWQYNGKNLDEPTADGRTTKDGEPLTIFRGACYNINNIIHGMRQWEVKQLYLTDYEENHGEIAVPFMWDIDTYTDYVTIDDMLNKLTLTDNQMWILNKRLQGVSVSDIARKKGTGRTAIYNALDKIGKQYLSIFGDVSVSAMAKAKA